MLVGGAGTGEVGERLVHSLASAGGVIVDDAGDEPVKRVASLQDRGGGNLQILRLQRVADIGYVASGASACSFQASAMPALGRSKPGSPETMPSN